MTDYRQTTGKRTNRQTSGLLNDAFNAGQNLVDNTRDQAEQTYNDTKDAVNDTFESAGDQVQETQDDGGLIGQGQDAIDDAFSFSGGSDDGDSSGDSGGSGSFIDDTANFFGDTADDVVETAEDTGNSINNFQEEAVDFIAGEGTADSIQDGAQSFIDDTQERFEETQNQIDNTFDGFTDTVEDFGEGAFDASAGAGDFLAGSTDEAFSRTFDNQQGGGIFDVVNNTADNLAGSFDESIGRQFDSTPGGGVLDPIGDLGSGAFDIAGDAADFGGDLVNLGIEGAMSIPGQVTNIPSGGSGQNSQKQWSELTEVVQMGNCIINKQSSNQGDTRYITISSDGNGNTVGVKADGSFVNLPQMNWMSEAPWHSSLQKAKQACEAAGLDMAWGEFERVETHNGGIILKQTASDGTERFAALAPDDSGNRSAVAADGGLVTISEGESMSDIPTYPNIASARDALNKTEGTTRQWGPLERVGKEGNCIIMKQQSSDDNTRYFTTVQSGSGETIALANDGTGKVVSTVDNAQNLPHYPTESDARAACPSNSGTPSNGGSNWTTDDSTSNGGPTSGETEQPTGGSSPTTQPGGSVASSILSGDIAGIPIPVVGGGAVVAAGALATLLGGDDAPRRVQRQTGTPTRTGARSNVTRRGGSGNTSRSGNNN